jgi:hypothetical protein
MTRVGAITMLVAIVIAGCAADDAGSASLPTNPDTTTSSPGAASSGTSIDPGDGIGDGSGGSELPVIAPELSDEVDAAVADLRDRLGTDEVIEVVVAHELTWPDGSLGCPQSGMSYTQALVPGYRIELAAGDQIYEYHGASGVDPFLCENI